MSNRVSNLRRIEWPVELPYGEYDGTISGYVVEFTTPSGRYEGRVIGGIRGTSPCKVTVDDGVITYRITPQPQRAEAGEIVK